MNPIHHQDVPTPLCRSRALTPRRTGPSHSLNKHCEANRIPLFPLENLQCSHMGIGCQILWLCSLHGLAVSNSMQQSLKNSYRSLMDGHPVHLRPNKYHKASGPQKNNKKITTMVKALWVFWHIGSSLKSFLFPCFLSQIRATQKRLAFMKVWKLLNKLGCICSCVYLPNHETCLYLPTSNKDISLKNLS